MRGGFAFVPESSAGAAPAGGSSHVDPLTTWLQTPRVRASQLGADLFVSHDPPDPGNGTPITIEGLLQPLPAGLVPPYSVEMTARESHSQSGYPLVGVGISDGASNGSRIQSIYRYQGSYGVGSALQIVGSPYSTGTTHTTIDGTSPNFTGATALHVRIVHDGTYLWFQTSSDGVLWGLWGQGVSYASLLPGGGGTNPNPLTHYGIMIGCSSGQLPGAARITDVRARALRKAAIVSATYDAPTRRGSFVLDTPLDLLTGSCLSFQGVIGSGGRIPQTDVLPYSGIVATDSTHIVVPAMDAFTGVHGGQVLDLTR